MTKEIHKTKINEIDLKNISIKTIIGLYYQYKEIINYLVFGGLATVVNFASYFIFAKLIGIEKVTSSGLSWFVSVLFAYITNKLFVFESQTSTKKGLFKEFVSFFLARVVSGLLCDIGTFSVMVNVLKINDMLSKFVTQVMVVVVNYLFSKFVVFKNSKFESK